MRKRKLQLKQEKMICQLYRLRRFDVSVPRYARGRGSRLALPCAVTSVRAAIATAPRVSSLPPSGTLGEKARYAARGCLLLGKDFL